jgi:thymidylate synthase
MLVLNPDKTNFYDFTIEDFEMVNYEPMKPQLKLELGI